MYALSGRTTESKISSRPNVRLKIDRSFFFTGGIKRDDFSFSQRIFREGGTPKIIIKPIKQTARMALIKIDFF